MRVLIASHYALPHVGGIEVLVEREIRALVEEGHNVTLVTSDAGGKAQTPDYGPLVRVVRVPASYVLERDHQLAYPIFYPGTLSTLWREIGEADVVHAHGLIYLVTVAAAAIGRMRGKPVILTDHGGIQSYHHPLATVAARIATETLGRLSSRSANKLVAYNSRVLGVMRHLGGARRRAQFLPYPIDTSLFKRPSAEERRQLRAQRGWPEGRPKVLFVGRLISDKGIHILEDARSPEFDVAFCGSGDPAILGLPREGIEYLPPRPQPELVKLYQAADILVLPSSREAFPLVAREAMACGLPVILGDDPGYEPYLFLHGLRTTERTPAAVREAILSVLSAEPRDLPVPAQLAELCQSSGWWVRELYGDVMAAPRGATVTQA